MKITTKTFRNVSIAVFLIVSVLVVGGFAQDAKKLKQKPSSPFKGDEKVAVNSVGVLSAPLKALSKTPSIRVPVNRPGNKTTQSDVEIVDEDIMSVQKKKNKVTVDDDGPADYADIQAAIDGESDETDIEVMPGTYAGFTVVNRYDLKIKGKKGKKDDLNSDVVVTGSVTAASYRGTYSLTIGVVDSIKIDISNFIVVAGNTDPFTIAYFDSTGKVKDNDITGPLGNSNPGNGIAAFGISSPGKVKIEKNYIHDYGKIGILVNSWNPAAGAYVPGGIYAEIKKNTIMGTDLGEYYRVQDGIQITNGGSAKIEDNDISGKLPKLVGPIGPVMGYCSTIPLKSRQKRTISLTIKWGLRFKSSWTSQKIGDDKIEYNEWGIYTWNWVASIIES